ncbi:DUF1501 domain-containing protein [Humisphaera borealis]|uniref:DUF1501 domain-containing protein n=1 Tax=Humisphaera borealis TaxID=2807512 RepID=A0A7M2WUI0_9BACT|nr:DUF1501 domain-containing protein [Humisphaera borealis]QOV88822.1 DUF1501 domain-containing protein [Humisphaera borealis]
MHPDFLANLQRVTRRQLFGKSLHGVGLAALASMMKVGQAPAATSGMTSPVGGAMRGLPNLPHYPAKAKSVICLWQGGGPSHLDLFDYKPVLTKMAGQDIPESVRGTTRLSTMSASYKKWPITPAIKPFKKCGQSGTEISTLLPYTSQIADDICVVRSMNTEAVNHAPGVTFFMTGAQVPGRPSMGAWATYGLGCEADDLPGFVVMTSSDKGKTCGQLFFDYYWGSGFLPSRYQGVRFRGVGDPVPYIANPPGTSRQGRRELLDDLQALNAAHLADYGDPEIDTRISQYEMAFKMQGSVPDLLDFSTEPKHIINMYGPDALIKGTYANNCLIARRLIERGVRFVQLMHAGWDQHGNLFTQLEGQCKDTDQPSAALVADLKQRGLLDDTLVVWGGEFGRTPFGQGDPAKPAGRDHFGRAYSMWLAGGGVKPGSTFGETDDFAWNITKDPVHIHDMQATILHLMGINHEALTFKYQGRQYRLTDVHGHVMKGMLA